MSTLAERFSDVGLLGRGSPAAGVAGNKIDEEAYRAIGTLRSYSASPGSWIFNDLAALAEENGVSFRAATVFRVAQRFLLALPTHIPVPELSLDEDGEIALDWAGTRGRMFPLTMRKDGRITYALRLSSISRKRGTEYFENEVPKEILDCIEKTVSDR